MHQPRPCQFSAALGEDAGERASPVSNLLIFGFGEFGFGGDEAAFAGGFEDGGAVAFEVGLHPPQRRHPRLQPRELLLNLRHNPPLFGSRGARWKAFEVLYAGTDYATFTRASRRTDVPRHERVVQELASSTSFRKDAK